MLHFLCNILLHIRKIVKVEVIDMTSEFKFAVVFVVVGFILVALFSSIGASGLLLVFLVAVSALVIVLFLLKRSMDKEAVRKQFYSFDEKEKTLTLYKSNTKLLQREIAIVPHYEFTFKFNPAELVYTGATVGGITTGGFHVNQASYSPASSKKSGKYELTPVFSEEMIRIIILPEELHAAAETDPVVGQFYRNGRLILEHTGPDTKLTPNEDAVAHRAVENHRDDILIAITNLATTAKRLTLNECNAVKNFICR